MPRWSKLTRKIRDIKDRVTLRTKKDVEDYMLALPKDRETKGQWQIVAGLLLEGADAKAVTRAIELALSSIVRLDINHTQAPRDPD
jgi:hypothetical protein